jgi:RHS repeat-associated protein
MATRLTSGGIAAYQYVYDAGGTRVAKGSIHLIVVNGQQALSCDVTQNGFLATNSYGLGLGGEQVTETKVSGGASAWAHTNVYSGGTLLGTYDPQGLHFQLEDWLGSRRVQTNAFGQVEEHCTNSPYGNNLNCTFPGNAPSSADDATEHHFTGKERDAESGLDYFGARYYASSMGRWMSPDWSAAQTPVPYAKMDDPQSLNLYAYVGNNPLRGIDADGHNPHTLWSRIRLWTNHHDDTVAVGEFDKTGKSDNLSTHAGFIAANTDVSHLAVPNLVTDEDWGSQRNAVRHVLWQGTITKRFGADFAKQVGDAHEDDPDGTSIGPDFRIFPRSRRGLQASDDTADLLNNKISRFLGSSLPGINPIDNIKSVLEYYHTVGLYQTVDYGDKLVVQIVPLSDADYSAAMKNVGSMVNANGRVAK